MFKPDSGYKMGKGEEVMTIREAADAMAETLTWMRDMSCDEDVAIIDALLDNYRAACKAEGMARTAQNMEKKS